jgi:hypothetical protein
MTESDDVNRRLSKVEHEVARAREDAAAARVLAGGADRDVSAMQTELRAHTRSLEALRKTQLEQSREMRDGFARVDGEMRDGFERVDAETRRSYSMLAQGQQRITELLTMHINQCEPAEEG